MPNMPLLIIHYPSYFFGRSIYYRRCRIVDLDGQILDLLSHNEKRKEKKEEKKIARLLVELFIDIYKKRKNNLVLIKIQLPPEIRFKPCCSSFKHDFLWSHIVIELS